VSRELFQVVLTAAQVSELFGILAARQQLAQRMYDECKNTSLAGGFSRAVEIGGYWQRQVMTCEGMRQALSAGCKAPPPAAHRSDLPGHA
jgi:hypothetical protein